MAIGVTAPMRKRTIVPDTLRARTDGAPVQTAPPQRRRSQLLLESAGEASGMKPEPTEIRVERTRPSQEQEV